MTAKKNLIVIGNGMVGHKFLELMVSSDAAKNWNLITFCEEQRVAYDRVNLSGFFSGKTAGDLSLVAPGFYQENGIQIHIGDKAVAINREQKTVSSANGLEVPYDKLVLATGSYPFVPPIKGKDAAGTFVYRTIDDLEAMSDYAKNCKIGVVIGGGLLGLECANALQNMGLKTHVVEFASRLMPVQVDEVGGAILRNKIEELGVSVHTSKSTTEIVSEDGKVSKMLFADGSELATDMIVFSAGIRPRDEIARDCGIAVGERGGITINDSCQTSDSDIYAIGECALYQNRIYGLVAPGYTMAGVAADILSSAADDGQDARPTSTFTGADMSTKLKLLGVDVASFGDAFANSAGAKEIVVADNFQGTYKKLVLNQDGSRILGGILVGDASAYGTLLQFMQNDIALPPHPEDLLMPPREGGAPAGFGVESLPDSAQICSCNNVSKGQICEAIRDRNLTDVGSVKKCTQAGTGCGGCVPLVTDIFKSEMKKAGFAVKNNLCEHFEFSRQELYHLVRSQELKSFDETIAKHGKGHGCEICKPAVASMLASTWNDHILEKSHVGLQDTNDYYLANIQRDGTYSVIPRIPGGEITPERLIALGEVARDFGLYTKITGGQRIDLLGARVDQLPHIWHRLIDAGFESGHAYGKALRTVKSCVGSTWCRFGVQDSTSLAIEVELRYRGLRSPHKLKSAVSGCTRECAEAQSKDFGIIATENGWNLYVCGNGGIKPQHAVLLAADIDKETLIKYIDRFLVLYIRTADRLERTATWLNKLEGGIEYLKQVVIEDSLGICAELEAQMEHLVNTYQCEWKTTIEDPQKVQRFQHFVNSDLPDPSIVRVEERGQNRPAYEDEKALAGVSE
ncbi:MAG: nitrite reductase large subunit [Microcoleus sp. PH2017_25_DOB_D_A]|uniref:nitrite reductase large subunit NirB n=1 Tax=unclassified Microcoleus TaxID=2642155 RepID=UPI001D54312D|nr:MULTISPECIES: nitrite reductase large subunit NirB [unclassified Microcoleus]TAE07884.1 MAG: nitrite reductase large subunit [Oscillatoriales cyanobacterium]MCC3538462.1 nitrite reductase large subunit [Microcoleus sp. PH2017_25_DOB_D_A]MCC3551028.1 nitrite reductase large subunit [Microcoleus sp. PH2017_24_DOB_U_A]MCC3573310.1 nitrite reductase large subunit [Microcoleus sp. PH2017_34_RAT_O_A]MCC3613723.1 nitrite reductase large subunit [Microcoleus sp. PH2017_40_RAT_O_B]